MKTNAIMHNHSLTSKAARLRPLSWMMMVCFGLSCSLAIGPAISNPIGPQVVHGKAEIVQQGNILTITNSNNAIINWQNFSIGPDEITRFVQPSSASSVLNRVQGAYPSQILGALQSNGKVFLINPNGILFGNGARVDVNGLIASSLQLSNEDFLAGKRNFSAGSKAETVENRAAITTPSGGQVFLLAPNVVNNGLITAANGDIVLAAGRSVQLVDSGNPDLHVVVSAPENQAINLGQIISQGGRIGIYGALVNQRGNVNANSAVLGSNGKIVLKASRDAVLESGSQTSAKSAAGQGGNIAVLGQTVRANGNAQVDASGATGGGTVLIGGDFQGSNPNVPNAEQNIFSKDASVRADATQSGNGGKIILWSDKTTKAYGDLSARGAGENGVGGLVEVSSKKYLDFRAKANLMGGKPGQGGTLLLDPELLVIQGGTGEGATDGNNNFRNGDNVIGSLNYGDGLSVIYQSELEGIAQDTNIVLQATRRIETAGSFTNSKVQLQNNNSLQMSTRNASTDPSSGTKGIDLTTSADGAGLEFATSGSGTIELSSSTALYQSAGLKVGKLTTAGGTITLNAKGDVEVAGEVKSFGGEMNINAENILFSTGGSANAGAGHMHLNTIASGGSITLSPNTSLSATSSGLTDGIDLVADNINLPVTGNNVINLVGDGKVILTPKDLSRDVQITTNKTGNKLELDPAGLSRISAKNLAINTNAAQLVDSPTTLAAVEGLQLTGTSVTVNQPVTLSASNGRISLNANGPIVLNSTGSLSTSGNLSYIGLMGESMQFNGSAGQINGGSGRVVIQPLNTPSHFNVGVGAVGSAGILSLTEDDLRKVTTSGSLEIGSSDPNSTWAGNLAVTSGGLDLTGGGLTGQLLLNSGAASADMQVHGPLKAPGNVFLTSRNKLTLSSTASISGTNIGLVADKMDLQSAAGSVNAGNGAVALAPYSSNSGVKLGGVTGSDSINGALEISTEEANVVGGSSSGKLRIGAEYAGYLHFVGPFNPTFPGNVILFSGGDITQGTGAIITANNLGIVSHGAVELLEPNMVNGLAARVGDNESRNSSFQFNNAKSLNLAAGVDNIKVGNNTLPLSGIFIDVDGSTYNSQSPNGVVKVTSTGALTQSQGAAISAKALYAKGKSVVLNEANSAGNIAGESTGTDAADVFRFKNTDSILVNQVGGFHGIAHSGPNEAAAIHLVSTNGSVGQTNAASITSAGALKVESASHVMLSQATGNNVAAFGASANGDVSLSNTGALSIGSGSFGITSNNGDIEISSGNNPLTVAANVNAGAGNVALHATNLQLGGASGVSILGNYIELESTASPGQISTAGTASQIGNTSTSSIDLIGDSLNFSAAKPVFTANSQTGAISLRTKTDNYALNLGSNAIADWNANALVFGEGDPSKIYTTGDITIGTSITAQSKLGFFSGGSITQTAPITSSQLVLAAGSVTGSSGAINLTSNNQVGTVSAVTNGGHFSLKNIVPLTIGGYTYGNATIDGITTNNGNLSIDNTGAIIINNPLNSGSGDIDVIAHSPLNVNSAITSTTGNIRLEAGASGSISDNLVISAQGSVNSTSGNVNLKAGNNIVGAARVTTNGAVVQQPNQNPPPLPNINDCIADPATAGCSSVLPSLSSCIATPTALGCSVVLPSLTSCLATPTLSGCQVVLPNLTACIATPTLPGCQVVLPNLTACIATPTLPGCSVILPNITACIATPSLPGCEVVLPNITACIATPTLPGCSVVLPNITACIATPTLPGCSAVLPNLTACIATPTLPGCSVTLPNLTACIATPTLPGCSVVLPNLTACIATPTLPGCQAVLPNLTACIATPTLPGCQVVLPNLTACIATPTLPGCQIVLPNLTACIATPTLPGCQIVLPNLTACIATPTLPGCSVTLPNLTACIATPTLPGCSVVLPNITACIATPTLPGCSITLPNITACIATPSLPGCEAVLPNLVACIATPTLPGCSVTLPNLSACISTPTLPGCSVVLPNLSACIATPTLPGCNVVLPNLTACIATPSLPGCSVSLPSLTACIATPTLPGCSAVLPSLSQCTATPSLPGCLVVLPVTQASGKDEPVTNAIDSSINVINTTSSSAVKPTQTPTIFAKLTEVPKPEASSSPAPSSNAKTGNSNADTKLAAADNKAEAKPSESKTEVKKEDSKEPAKEEKKEEKKDDKTTSNKDSGAKKDEPAKKMYCN